MLQDYFQKDDRACKSGFSTWVEIQPKPISIWSKKTLQSFRQRSPAPPGMKNRRFFEAESWRELLRQILQ
jgi:hypothetical protein